MQFFSLNCEPIPNDYFKQFLDENRKSFLLKNKELQLHNSHLKNVLLKWIPFLWKALWAVNNDSVRKFNFSKELKISLVVLHDAHLKVLTCKAELPFAL